MSADITLGQIEDDINFNFKNKFDDDKEVFTDNLHSCEYYEMDDLRKKFANSIDCFSTYSHNIRSINGHWNDVLDIIYSAQPIKCSVISLLQVNKKINCPTFSTKWQKTF